MIVTIIIMSIILYIIGYLFTLHKLFDLQDVFDEAVGGEDPYAIGIIIIYLFIWIIVFIIMSIKQIFISKWK